MGTRSSKVAFALVWMFASSLCVYAGERRSIGGIMEKRNTDRVAKLFERTKTICIGRFLLDAPFESQVIYGPAELPYAIERLIGRGPDFDDVIRERQRAILGEDRKLASGELAKEGSLLGNVVDGKVPSQKIVFGVARASGSHYMLESYQQVGNDLYVQEVASYGDGYANELAELNSISPLLVPRHDDKVPSEPGICLDGAFLAEPAQPIYEYVTLGLRLNGFNDVHFSIEMTKKDQLVESDALEPRVRRAEVEARKSGAGKWYDRVKVFRRGYRSIGSWTGYEYLAWKPAFGKSGESHVFAFVSHGEPSNPMLPVLDLSLDTGVRGNETSGTRPSLTDDEAVYVWDKLISSIRQRPIKSAPP